MTLQKFIPSFLVSEASYYTETVDKNQWASEGHINIVVYTCFTESYILKRDINMKVILIVTICSILCLLSCKASRLSGKNVHDLLFVCCSYIAKHPNVIFTMYLDLQIVFLIETLYKTG